MACMFMSPLQNSGAGEAVCDSAISLGHVSSVLPVRQCAACDHFCGARGSDAAGVVAITEEG